MYANNVFSKRRPGGWVERRRRYDRLVEQARPTPGKPGDNDQDAPEQPKR